MLIPVASHVRRLPNHNLLYNSHRARNQQVLPQRDRHQTHPHGPGRRHLLRRHGPRRLALQHQILTPCWNGSMRYCTATLLSRAARGHQLSETCLSDIRGWCSWCDGHLLYREYLHALFCAGECQEFVWRNGLPIVPDWVGCWAGAVERCRRGGRCQKGTRGAKTIRDGLMVLCWSCQRWVRGKYGRSEESRLCKRRGHGNTLKHRTSLSMHFIPQPEQ